MHTSILQNLNKKSRLEYLFYFVPYSLNHYSKKIDVVGFALIKIKKIYLLHKIMFFCFVQKENTKEKFV